MPERWALPDRDAALNWCAKRNEQGMRCILDVLGRYNRERAQALESYNAYLDLMGQVKRHRLNAALSIKPSTLGGTMGRDVTQELVRGLCEKGAALGVAIEMDMEGQRMVDLTLELAEDCARSGMKPTVALQAYLHRTPQDVERMLDAGVRIRLVKGAYTGDVSDFDMISEIFRDLVEQILSRDVPFCVGTHDPDLLEWVQNRVCDHEILEFSFLKGLADGTKGTLVSEGWKVSEYIPFGPHKEGYEARRKAYLRTLDELGRLPAP
ncbi:MAG: proline dehydrogenase family protein [Methanomassiliicoccus sp.]|nr:proline dehydrogenase family protein [Methanomassiliicoccus sp.]